VFVGLLALGCIAATRVNGAAPVAPTATVPTTASESAAPERRAIPGGTVVLSHPGDLERAYRAAVGPDDGVGARGAPTCERGQPDERAWSAPGAPGVVVGRYACRHTATGAAEMWWTDGDAGLLAHATREDGDLAALFAWWRSAAS
jgi:hypothetical protein